jgi:hypothetical protein
VCTTPELITPRVIHAASLGAAWVNASDNPHDAIARQHSA